MSDATVTRVTVTVQREFNGGPRPWRCVGASSGVGHLSSSSPRLTMPRRERNVAPGAGKSAVAVGHRTGTPLPRACREGDRCG